MVSLKKYNLEGKEIEEVQVDEGLFKNSANSQMIKDYIVALRANARQWSASTKGRSDVKCTNKKPHPQKGTGRARQGSVASPQFKGGGIVFGPKPKFNQHVRINRKERRKAIQYLVSKRMEKGNVHLLQLENLDLPKTKKVASFLNALSLLGKRVLFLGEVAKNAEQKESSSFKQCETFVKSMRNIPRVSFLPAQNLNGYDLMLNQEIIVMDSAYEDLIAVLKGESK